MTEIYVIRHVQAAGNLYRMMQGQWDGEVTALGLRQRDALAERFRDIPVDALYSSDLSRALFTAEAITRYHTVPVQTDRRLREISVGPWEGVPFANLDWAYPEAFWRFMHDSEHFYFEGCETFCQVQDRAAEALRDIAEANPEKTVVITSHGVAIRCMLSRIFGQSLSDSDAVPIFANTGVARILYENGEFQCDYLNDSSHLSDVLKAPLLKGIMLRDECADPAECREFYLSCYADAWRSAHGDTQGFDPEAYYLNAVSHFRADPTSICILYDGDSPVGLLDYDTRRGVHADYGWLSLIYLKPEYRNRGLGIQLLGRALVKYDFAGLHALRLNVAEENSAALAFYRKWGFRELSHQNGGRGRLLLMERKLRGVGNGNV